MKKLCKVKPFPSICKTPSVFFDIQGLFEAAERSVFFLEVYVGTPDRAENHLDAVLHDICFRHFLVKEEGAFHAYVAVAYHGCRKVTAAVVAVGKDRRLLLTITNITTS